MNSVKNNKIYFAIFSICFIYFLLFSAFYLTCFFDRLGLYKLIISYKTYENLPFSLKLDDVRLIAEELMQYISGKLQFLETKVTINNVLTDFYSVRSKIHMADVRNIIVNLMKIYYLSIIGCIFSAFKIINHKDFIITLKKIYYRVVIIVTVLIVAILLVASINFNSFFIKFHHILFTNDLWLLDPNVDYIICLLPEKIFMTYGFKIIIGMLISIALSLFLLHILSKIQSHQEAI